ncbi:hypothetical protein [Pseudobacter ginsenosidimutans]|uniref:hypothetical protein n=1 Tax=Pseudobacter ginsenosidimutans TaxID=661488 RepID=UPI00102DC379|nr:hypothetical protein [Pseudobacter ginsenosidimutans]QEC44654.1 hypothetical protein FSB84_24325 [Pseudobacter ginsenosidimutans]
MLFLLCNATQAQYEYLLNKTYSARCDSLWRIGEAVYGHRDTAGAFSITKPILRVAQQHHDAALEVELKARTVLAEYYWASTNEYELALDEYKKLERLLAEVSIDEQYPEKTKVLFEIGNSHFCFKDYNSAIYYTCALQYGLQLQGAGQDRFFRSLPHPPL